MEPLAWLGMLAVVIGIIGVIVLVKGQGPVTPGTPRARIDTTAMSRRTSFIPRWFIVSAALILLVPALTVFLNHSAVQRLILQRLKAEIGLEASSFRVRLVPRLALELMRSQKKADLVRSDLRCAEASQ